MDVVIPPFVRVAVDRFAGKVRARFGDRVRDVVLFGSRARGEGHAESDTDVLVVVDGLTHEERKAIWDLAYDTRLELPADEDALVAPFAVSTEEYDFLRARERRIVKDIDRDGIRW